MPEGDCIVHRKHEPAIKTYVRERGFKVGKTMSICQRIMGILLCILLIVSMFIPRYAIKADKIAEATSSIIEDYMKKTSKKTESILGIAGGIADISGAKDYITENLNESLEDIKTSYSCFYIAINSPEKVLYEELGGKKNFRSIDKMMDTINKDSSENKEIVLKGMKEYNILRILIWIYVFFIILVFAGIMIEWFTKLKRWIYLVFTWCLCSIEAVYFIVVQFILIQKSASGILNAKGDASSAIEQLSLLGIDIDSLVHQFIKKLVWCLHSSGYYMAVIVSVLFFIWSIWCVICREKELTVIIDGSIQDDTESYVIPVLTETECGTIRGLEGVFMGADISLGHGEKIFVGRDPSDCQLVLPEPNISRKHFSVEFNQLSGMYHIKCFSSHGLKLSDDIIVAPLQELDVAHGTKIIMAKGQEVLLLL